MWAIVAALGVIAPTFATLVQLNDVESISYFGILTALAAQSYGIANEYHVTLSQRLSAAAIAILATLWAADTASGYLFDVQIQYPWWAAIEIALLSLVLLNFAFKDPEKDTGYYAYVKRPDNFISALACLFGGGLVTSVIEHKGKAYGFRRGKLTVIQNFNHRSYKRMNVPEAWGAKFVASIGKPWRPWRNCVLIIGKPRRL